MQRKTLSHAFGLIAPLLLAVPALHGQTTPTPVWVTITPESTTTAVTLPAGATYRFGDYVNNKWSAPVTVYAPTTISPVSMASSDPFPFGDPDYGTAKELDVLETSSPQTVSVTNLTMQGTTSQIIPAQTTTTTPASPTTGTWFDVVPASSQSLSITVTLPAGTTYRFGDTSNNRWTDPITTTAITTISDYDDGLNGRPADPDPGVSKELDVLETASSQSITVANSAAGTTVAQIVPPLVAPAVVPVTPGTAYTLTFSNFSIAPGSQQNALMLALVNSPPNGANQTWEGTQMNLTIDGVTLVCTYGQTYTNAVFSMNCTVPTTP